MYMTVFDGHKVQAYPSTKDLSEHSVLSVERHAINMAAPIFIECSE